MLVLQYLKEVIFKMQYYLLYSVGKTSLREFVLHSVIF